MSWIESNLSKDIWEKKYRYNGESFEDWLNRVTNNNELYKKAILNKEFLPAGRILANRGLQNNNKKITYSNCYVLSSPADHLESIFECASKLARTYSYGGGCGISLRNLRPKDAVVNNAAKTTTGATSFMDLYSLTTSLIAQNGRRGALMISLPISHPDIIDFIDIKNDLSKVNFANISIEITNDFMNSVVNDEEYNLTFFVEPTGQKIQKTVNAKVLFHKICENAWRTGEPGILFWDNICNHNFLNSYDNFKYEATNPCA